MQMSCAASNLYWIWTLQVGILSKNRWAAIIFDPYPDTVVVLDRICITCGRTCTERADLNRMGRIRKNVQGTERWFYRSLNAKTPRI